MISQELMFDASSAEGTINSLDQQLQQVGQLFQVSLADALAVLSQPLVVPVSADTAQAESEIGALASAPPVDVPVSADTAEAEAGIAGLADAPPVDVPVSADTAEAEAAIDGLGDVTTVDVPVTVDTAAAAAEIETLAEIPVDITVGADVSEAAAEIDELAGSTSEAAESSRGLGGSLTGLSIAAGATSGSAEGLTDALAGMGGRAKVAGGAAAILAASTATLFAAAIDAKGAQEQYNLVLGDMADEVEAIDVGSLNRDLSELTVTLGGDDEALLKVAARIFQLGTTSGRTREQVAETTEQIIALAANARALNPELGTVDTIAQGLTQGLARGGRAASKFGIDLSSTAVSARAAELALADGRDVVTQFDKVTAGAQIALEKLGPSLDKNIAEGAKNSVIQLDALKERFQNTIEQAGQPLVVPILELIEEATPIAALFAEVMGNLAGGALPAVTGALALVEPPLQLVAFILGEIPAPIITATAAALLAIPAITALSGAFVGLALPILPLAIAVGVVVGGIAAFNAITGDAEPFVNDLTKAVDKAAQGFDDYAISVRDVVAAVVDAAVGTSDFAERLNDAGVSADAIKNTLIDGGDSYDQYSQKILGTVIANDGGIESFKRVSAELEHLRDATQDAARETLTQAQANGEVTESERTVAEATAGSIDGHVNWAKALDILQPKLKEVSDATKTQAEAEKDSAAAMDKATQATKDLNAAQQSLIDSTLSSFQAALALTDAQISSRAAIEEATAANADHSLSEDEKTSATNDAFAAILSEASASEALASATAKASGETITAAQAQSALVGELTGVRDTLSPGSPLRAQLQGYIDTLNAIPANKTTQFDVDLSLARQKLLSMRNEFGVVPGFNFQLAEGGLVNAPRGAAVPAIVHGGEYVMTADMVDAIKSGAGWNAGVGGGASRAAPGAPVAAGGDTNIYVTVPPGTVDPYRFGQSVGRGIRAEVQRA